MTSGITGALCGLGVTASSVLAWRAGARRERRRRLQDAQTLARAERENGKHLSFSIIEALAYALEAGDPDNRGHLDCVQRNARALSSTLNLSEEEATALRAAALLHNIGRLGVPEHILRKTGALTPEEQEKLHTHPIVGACILASIPFPWPVVPIVRHHAEHWDGNGYPDGLKGSVIPMGARILAVANAYSALLRPRPYRVAMTAEQALTEIEARSGTQFDPAIVAAFRSAAADIREEETGKQWSVVNGQGSDNPAQSKITAPYLDIGRAQQETRALTQLTQQLASSLHLEAVTAALLDGVSQLVPCDACALFLPEEGSEMLRCHAALGVNQRQFLGSVARAGTYLTGRAFSRGESRQAGFVPDDLELRDVSASWTPLRSTLIVPLIADGQTIGTLNLYAQAADAFDPDCLRVLRLAASQASHALENARRFESVQQTATTDALTGLRNGRYLREFLERELNRAQREELPLAALMLDLDQFKPINDTYGHAIGDQILRDVADILNSQLRSYDMAARYAGDEFVVVLTRTAERQAQIVADKLRKAVDKHAARIQSRDPEFPRLGISVGVAVYPTEATDLHGLLVAADAAMYADKQMRKQSRAA